MPSALYRYFKQFAGRQQKLAAFFVKRTRSTVDEEDSQSNCNSQEFGKHLLSSSVDFAVTSQNSDDSYTVDSVAVDIASNRDTGDNNVDEWNRPLVSIGVKRPASAIVGQSMLGKTKKSSKDSSLGSRNQSSLLKFFSQPQRSNCHSVETSASESKVAVDSLPASLLSRTAETWKETSDFEVEPTIGGSLASSSSVAWKNLLKGPPAPPLCKGHREPCVLRTVKKSGPNQGI